MPDRVVLSEAESKELLRSHGVPTTREILAADAEAAGRAAIEIGFPVAAKLCARGLAHKTERGLVRLGLASEAAVVEAATELLALRGEGEADAGVLVQEMISGRRELIAGVVRDPHFGPCVMLGLGGIFTEALADVAFRVAPVDRVSAREIVDDLTARRVLGAFRGEPAVDRDRIADVLIGLGDLAVSRGDVASIDVNPLIVSGDRLVAVDALVELEAAP